MKAYWTNQKPDGTAITDGRLARVVDSEDGSSPIWFYGKTEGEVYAKIERTMVTAQSTLVRERTTPSRGPVAVEAAPAADARILSADQIMELTRDQQIPQKAPQAAARLADHYRAVERQKISDFARMSMRWQATHPELVDNNFNKKLITDNAMLRTRGDMSAITPEILESVFQELTAGGFLVTEVESSLNNNEPALPVQAEGTPTPVPTRQQTVISATTHRSTRLGPSQVTTWKPKYTVETLNKLSMKETEALLDPRNPGHKEYIEACNYWYPPAREA